MREQAVVFHAPNEVRVADIRVPEPAADEVQVRTIASMISTGTERWILSDRFSRTGTPYPCVPGYQRVGIVEKIGSEARGGRVGQKVIATSGMSLPGYSSNWGGHLSLGNTKVDEIYPVPSRIGDAEAAGIVVAQVGYNAAFRPSMREGDWIVVYGDGLIGQCASQAARARGARTILVGRRAERLAVGALHSADYVIDARERNVAERVRERTGSAYVTAVLDTLQMENVQQAYLPLLETDRGQVVYCGHSRDKAWTDMAALQARGLTCHYVSGWTRERIEATLELMDEGAIKLAPLVTHRGTREQAPELYRMLCDNKEPFLGLIIDWRASL